MRKLSFVTMLAMACAEQVGPTTAPGEDEDDRLEPAPAEEVGEDSTDKGPNNTFANDNLRDPAVEVCKLLPQGDGACAHACDPVMLATFIPQGTCVTFSCTLTDGSLYRTGGCNTAD